MKLDPKGTTELLMVNKDSEKSIYCHNPSQESGKLCVNTGKKCEKLINQAVINEYS